MSKKKIPHKGKPKQATVESEDAVFRRSSSDHEEEYTTVVDFEKNKKYNKRLIENNWAKYESVATADLDFGEEEKDLPQTDDFNYLLKTASSDCSHFQFSSEKKWQSESNSVPSTKIFNLDLNILSGGLACLPFYKRIGLNENELSIEDKERFNKEANESLKDYKLLREKLLKKSETDSKTNSDNNLNSLEDSFKIKLDLDENKQSEEDMSLGFGEVTDKTVTVDIFDSKDCSSDEITKTKQKIFFSENENLEDWLDSVLDD